MSPLVNQVLDQLFADAAHQKGGYHIHTFSYLCRKMGDHFKLIQGRLRLTSGVAGPLLQPFEFGDLRAGMMPIAGSSLDPRGVLSALFGQGL